MWLRRGIFQIRLPEQASGIEHFSFADVFRSLKVRLLPSAIVMIALAITPSMAVEQAPATSQPTRNPRPVVQITADSAECDLGYVKPSSNHQAVFELKNSTDRPLTIRKAKSECRCMKVIERPERIEPGQAARIVVEVEFTADKERYSKRIILVTDDPKRPIISLKITADVGLPLVLKPEQIDLGKLEPGREYRTEIALANRGNKPSRPLYSTSTELHTLALIPRAAAPPQGKLTIPVTVTPKDQPGEHTVTVYVHTDSPDQPRLSFQVRYQVSTDEEDAAPGTAGAKETP